MTGSAVDPLVGARHEIVAQVVVAVVAEEMVETAAGVLDVIVARSAAQRVAARAIVVQLVVAVPTLQQVGSASRVQAVVAGPTEQGIAPGDGAVHPVVVVDLVPAVGAREAVAAALAAQLVVEGTCGDVVVVTGSPDLPSLVDDGVVALARCGAGRDVHSNSGGGCGEVENVEPPTLLPLIVLVERVIAAVKNIVARAAYQTVAAVEEAGSVLVHPSVGTAVQLVVAVTADEVVAPGSPTDDVVAAETLDHVVSSARLDHVGSGRSHEPVCSGSAHQRGGLPVAEDRCRGGVERHDTGSGHDERGNAADPDPGPSSRVRDAKECRLPHGHLPEDWCLPLFC